MADQQDYSQEPKRQASDDLSYQKSEGAVSCLYFVLGSRPVPAQVSLLKYRGPAYLERREGGPRAVPFSYLTLKTPPPIFTFRYGICIDNRALGQQKGIHMADRTKYQAGIKQVTVELNRSVAKKFKSLASTFDTSMAQVMRDLVDEWIKEREALLKDMLS